MIFLQKKNTIYKQIIRNGTFHKVVDYNYYAYKIHLHFCIIATNKNTIYNSNKYLGIYLTNDVQNLYGNLYKTLFCVTERKQIEILCSRIGSSIISMG